MARKCKWGGIDFCCGAEKNPSLSARVSNSKTYETCGLYRGRQQFRPDGNFAGWARRIATKQALDHLRRKRPEQSLFAESADAPQPDRLLQRETREQIQQACHPGLKSIAAEPMCSGLQCAG